MPIYEYECKSCGREFQALVLKRAEEDQVKCDKCGARDLRKLISRVAYHASEADRLASFDPSARQGDSFYRDTRNIGLSAKKRAQQMGVDLGSSFETKLDKLRSNPAKVFDEAD